MNTLESVAQPTLSPEAPKPRKRGKKEQTFLDYINCLSYEQDIKGLLVKWTYNVALPKGISLQQFRDNISNIEEETNADTNLIKQSIKNAYLNGWCRFYVPRTWNTQKFTPKIEQPKPVKETTDDINYF